jgi:hypothetical protein
MPGLVVELHFGRRVAAYTANREVAIMMLASDWHPAAELVGARRAATRSTSNAHVAEHRSVFNRSGVGKLA